MQSILYFIVGLLLMALFAVIFLAVFVALLLWLLHLVRRFLRHLRLLARVITDLLRRPAVTEWRPSPDGPHDPLIIVDRASVGAVLRDGPDVLVRSSDIGYVRSRLHSPGLPWIRCDVTVRFINCSRIVSRYHRSPAASRDLRLEPGWSLDRLTYDGIAAAIVVLFQQDVGFEQREDTPVTHELRCDGVRLTRRFSPMATLFYPLFRDPHRGTVDGEPRHSPPIPGQDQRAFGGSLT